MSRGVRRVPEPREWMLKKLCVECDETKPWAEFAPTRYWPDGSVRTVDSYCRVCKARRQKAWRQRDPEHARALWRAVYEKNRESILANQRERWLQRTPAEIQRERDRQQERNRRYRERHGERIKRSQSEWARRKRQQLRQDRNSDGPLIDAGPFVTWAEARMADGWGQGVLAECAGLTDRTLRRLMNGEQLKVRLDAVDRAAIATGFHLNDIYPPNELEDLAA